MTLNQVENYTALRGYSPAANETVFVQGWNSYNDGGEGFFYWAGVNSSVLDNGGTIIVTSASGVWLRMYTGSLNVQWFGAIPFTSSPTTDCTTAIQNALNCAVYDMYGNKRTTDIPNVYIPTGNYLISQISVHEGITLYGDNGSDQNGYGGSSLWQNTIGSSVINKSLIICNGIVPTGETLSYWYGTIRDLNLIGFTGDEPYNSSGFGISFRMADTSIIGSPSALEDTTIIENLSISQFPSGGIELPNGASPGYFQNIKLEKNGGPGISILYNSALNGDLQSTSFINISGDGNRNGLMYISGFTTSATLVFVNLKGENSNSNLYSTTMGDVEQQNFIVLANACQAMISIHGACNQPVVPISTGSTTLYAIGDLVYKGDTSAISPILFWNGVNFKYNTGQMPYLSAPAPSIFTGSGIPYTQSWGSYNTNGVLQLGLPGGYSPELSTTTSIDTITTSVTAFVPSGATGILPPGGGVGNLISLGLSAGYSNQLYLKAGFDQIFFRRNISGGSTPAYSTWRFLVPSDTVTTVFADADYPISSPEQFIVLDAGLTMMNRTLSLPNPALSVNAGRCIKIWNKSSGSYVWQFSPSVDLISGGTPITNLTSPALYIIQCIASNWVQIN